MSWVNVPFGLFVRRRKKIIESKKSILLPHDQVDLLDGQVGQPISCVSSYGRTTIYWLLCSTFWQSIRFLCKQEEENQRSKRRKKAKCKEKESLVFCPNLSTHASILCSFSELLQGRNFRGWPKFRNFTSVDFYLVEETWRRADLGSLWLSWSWVLDISLWFDSIRRGFSWVFLLVGFCLGLEPNFLCYLSLVIFIVWILVIAWWRTSRT